MNGYMNISVRVLSAQAQAQIKALQTEVAMLQKQLLAANRASAAGILGGAGAARSSMGLAALGSKMQWAGRQLSYNFTVPLLLAAGAATKFALDNEKAFVRVQKVYGDTSDAAAYFRSHQEQIPAGMTAGEAAAASFSNELDALKGSFEALSTTYGISQTEVLETASAWAAAGVSGKALAKATELSIKASLLGDINLAKATESLIAIQSQYSLSTKGLNLTLAELNAIENATAVSQAGLIDAFSRTAGTAREFGVDVRHLGAMIAALVPATGTASTAGQGLKTIMSRILSPTEEAAAVMREFGVDTSDAAWQSSTAMDRLLVLAKHMRDGLEETGDASGDAAKQMYTLSDSQRAVVATTLGSRYQVNRFLVLMRELNNENGNYAKALNATKNNQKVFATAQRELNAILDSSPKKLEILWYTIQNGMATAIQPMIPYFLYLVSVIANGVKAFGNLDPAVQKLVLTFLAGIAVFGLVVKFLGALMLLVALAFSPIRLLAVAFVSLFVNMGATAAAGSLVLRAWIPMVAAMLLTPFKLLIGGFMMLPRVMLLAVVGIFKVTRALVLLPKLVWASMVAMRAVVVAGWVSIQATWVAAMASLRIITALGAVAQVGIWATMGARMRVISMATWATVRAIWFANWSLMMIMANLGMRAVVTSIARGMVAVGAAMLGPWGIAIAAIVALIVIFRKQIVTVWNNVVSYFSDSSNDLVTSILNAFNALPQGVQNAMMAVVHIIAAAAKAIYDLFSYINPFAHHSPSLVENVEAGTLKIGSDFGTMASVIKTHIATAYSTIKAFGSATKGILGRAASFEMKADRKKVKKVAPGAVDEFDAMGAALKVLNRDLARMASLVKAQQAVVDGWQKKLDAANAALDRQSDKLDKLQAVQEKWQSMLDAANDKLSYFANAPLVGMRAMSDAIFENEMAQKRLKLAMMDLEDQGGGSFDSLKAKVEALNGAIELISGERADLRNAGAGSDILSQYDDQINALKAQQGQYTETANALNDMQTQLDALGRQGERLDLTNSLKFDPLTRQIQQAAEAMQELPFEQVMAGVQGARAEIDRYTLGLNAATAAVDAQQSVVDAMTAARDVLQQKLDQESKKLDTLKDQYDAVNEAIQAIEQSMSDVVAAADAMKAALDEKKKKKGAGEEVTPGVQNFRDAKGGNFADIGGAGIPIRTNWEDQTDQIKKYTDNIGKGMTDAFKDINPFGPLKSKWNDFVGWFKTNINPIGAALKDMVGEVFSGTGGASNAAAVWGKITDIFAKMGPFLTNVKNAVVAVAKQFLKWGGQLWDLFGPDILEIFDIIAKEFKNAFGDIANELKEFGPMFPKIGKAIQNMWMIAKPILAIMSLAWIAAFKVIFDVIKNVLPPIITTVGAILANLIQIIKGIVQVIVGIFTLDFGMMADGVRNIFDGLVQGIWAILKGAVQIIWGVISGLVEGIYGFFKWLYDELLGHSIIPDIINGFIEYLKLWLGLGKWVWDNVLKPIYNKFQDAWAFIKGEAGAWWERIKTVWSALTGAALWFWTNVLSPIFTKVGELWGNLKIELGDWWNRIKNLWSGLLNVGTWLKDNFADPIFEKITGVWTRISTWFTNNKDTLLSPVKAVVNAVIGGVNTLIGGLNKISDVLPKFEWHIDTIPQMATGGEVPGRRGSRGFKTNGARAIVGEGKANYPEFVIPTDPTYRQRAHSLLAMAASKLGAGVVRENSRTKGVRGDTPQDFASVARMNPKAALNAIPGFFGGGWLGDALHTVKDWTEGLALDSLGLVMNPALDGAESLVNKAGSWPPPKAPALSAIEKARGWFKDVNEDYKYQFKKDSGPPPKIKEGMKFAKSQVGKPYKWTGVGPDAYDCSGFMSAITNVVRGAPVHSRVGSTSSFPWGGFGPGVDPNKGFVIGSAFPFPGSDVGHMAGTIGGMNVESNGDQGVTISNRGWNSAGFNVHAGITGLKSGGIVPRGTDRLYRLGDGRYDEAVVPLPYGYRDTLIGNTGNSDGETHLHFYGDLSFPNVKSGDDAQSFMDNLESLAKD